MKIVVAGGVVRPQSFELVGPLGGALLKEVTLDVALLGVDALDVSSARPRTTRARPR
jgi:DeoR family transcriptional regulator of aga operon